MKVKKGILGQVGEVKQGQDAIDYKEELGEVEYMFGEITMTKEEYKNSYVDDGKYDLVFGIPGIMKITIVDGEDAVYEIVKERIEREKNNA